MRQAGESGITEWGIGQALPCIGGMGGACTCGAGGSCLVARSQEPAKVKGGSKGHMHHSSPRQCGLWLPPQHSAWGSLCPPTQPSSSQHAQFIRGAAPSAAAAARALLGFLCLQQQLLLLLHRSGPRKLQLDSSCPSAQGYGSSCRLPSTYSAAHKFFLVNFCH